jgi:hypothetical protein
MPGSNPGEVETFDDQDPGFEQRAMGCFAVVEEAANREVIDPHARHLALHEVLSGVRRHVYEALIERLLIEARSEF